MEFWLDHLKHPIDFSILKEKENIETEFLNKFGIIQKITYKNNIIGYFVACKLDKNTLKDIKQSLDTNIIFGTFIPKDSKYSASHIKFFAKKAIYSIGIRTIKKIVKNVKIDDYTSFYAKINAEMSNLFFITQDNDYINNIVERSRAFDERLARYYKNEKMLII